MKKFRNQFGIEATLEFSNGWYILSVGDRVSQSRDLESRMSMSEYKSTKAIEYREHTIEVVVDNFGQVFTIVDGNYSKLYASVSDAKRVIRGEEPKYIII